LKDDLTFPGPVIKIQKHDLLPCPEAHFALYDGYLERRADQCSPDMGIAVPVSPSLIVFIIEVFGGYSLDGIF